MEKDKKVTALYCRLSKDDGSNSESLSIRTQKAMLMEYATRNGFGNCQYYVDDGYSGTNSDRPAFQELLDDIREGKVATVITKDQSRLGRNHIETGTYMEIFFPEHGVRYIAINDGYDSNEQSQMDIAPFRNIINEMYAKDTSRKIKSALRTRKKSGKYISSGAPFGYQKDPADHNHLVIDPNTAPVVEYIYSMAEEGLGLHRIAKRLHDEKVLKPCYYKKEMFGRFIDDEKMYDWDSAYISQVLHSHDGMHSDYFREFVQMMLCHAWSIGFLSSDLWDAIPDIAQAATMHDIGKTALPETIIHKKGALSSAEREFVKAHTILGAAMVEIALAEMRDDPIYDYALEICRHHHERVNGRGYPDHLCGGEIASYVQVISLADAYDALRSPRSYWDAMTDTAAVKMLLDEECGAFDPDLIDAFEPILGELWDLARHLAEEPNSRD